MFKFILNYFRKKEPKIKFKSLNGDWSIATPVVPASQFKTQWQKSQSKEDSIVHCPGMHDYLSSGYIISAPVDYKIKATRVGTKIFIAAGSGAVGPVMTTPVASCSDKLKPELISGVFEPNNVKLEVCKISLPWSVMTDKGYSVYALPCLLQADYLDKIMIWPGVVDTDNFHIINVILSAKQECELTITAGTPLLHIIPFKREVFSGECGKASEKESDKYTYNIPSRVGQYYRKFYHTRKKFKMECSNEHRYL